VNVEQLDACAPTMVGSIVSSPPSESPACTSLYSGQACTYTGRQTNHDCPRVSRVKEPLQMCVLPPLPPLGLALPWDAPGAWALYLGFVVIFGIPMYLLALSKQGDGRRAPLTPTGRVLALVGTTSTLAALFVAQLVALPALQAQGPWIRSASDAAYRQGCDDSVWLTLDSQRASDLHTIIITAGLATFVSLVLLILGASRRQQAARTQTPIAL
jgi:hypothetical protein